MKRASQHCGTSKAKQTQNERLNRRETKIPYTEICSIKLIRTHIAITRIRLLCVVFFLSALDLSICQPLRYIRSSIANDSNESAHKTRTPNKPQNTSLAQAENLHRIIRWLRAKFDHGRVLLTNSYQRRNGISGDFHRCHH